MDFSLAEIIAQRQTDQYPLYGRHINPALARVQAVIGFDKSWARGEGAYLWDVEGERYLDLIAGYGTYNLGRDHPAVRRALEETLRLQRPNMVEMDCPLLAGLLAEALVAWMPSGLDTVFFANDGAGAVDTALKFARCATGRPRVLYLEHAFHGVMLGTLSCNGGDQFRRGFGPLMPGFESVPPNEVEALELKLSSEDVAAFIVEPIQGKGVYMPADNYLSAAQRLCRKYGTAFVCDEVQVGMGRTGRFLCSEHWGLQPDMVTLAKSLGGGFMPVSATVMRRAIYEKVYGRLDRCQVHTTTFGENELAMAAGLATLRAMDQEGLIEHAATMGDRLLAGLTELRGQHQMIADVRGKGLMIGIELRPPQALALKAAWTAAETAQKGLFAQLVVMSLMRDHHILTQVGGPDINIIKLLPPLIVGEQEVDAIVGAFDAVMTEAARVRGSVWRQSGHLIRQALSQPAFSRQAASGRAHTGQPHTGQAHAGQALAP
jgi:acetylornithine/succinyldiaminopimelate/putrescine aminotransferase